MKRPPIITIDGPAGAGKSTISRLVASRFSFICLDTGALYRAIAYRLKCEGWKGSIGSIAELTLIPKISLKLDADRVRVIADGEDVSEKIRSEEIGLLASKISAIPKIRESLLPVQRQLAAVGGVVAEGRDMGTVVFPNAEIKFFLDASLKERAKRRYQEMVLKGEKVNLTDIENDLIIRDCQDRGRSISPLIVPTGSVFIDSSNQSIQQVVDFMTCVVDRVWPSTDVDNLNLLDI